jgi:hypothetical protein
MGPDGALYVADFYNRIIGHYEVPLNNPGRDRIRGRIWRITYKGNGKPGGTAARRDWTAAPTGELLKALDHPNLPLRLMAADQLVERIGAGAVAPGSGPARDKQTSPTAYTHGLWVLQRLGALPEDVLTASLKHADAAVRVHALRVIGETPALRGRYATAARNALQDPNPHVQRSAVEALAGEPSLDILKDLLAFTARIPGPDSLLRYTARLGSGTCSGRKNWPAKQRRPPGAKPMRKPWPG